MFYNVLYIMDRTTIATSSVPTAMIYVTYIYYMSTLTTNISNPGNQTFVGPHENENYTIREYGYKTVLEIKLYDETKKKLSTVYTTKKNQIQVKNQGLKRVKTLRVGESVLLQNGTFARIAEIRNIGYQRVYEYIGKYKDLIYIDNVAFFNVNRNPKRSPISSYGVIAYRVKNQQCQFILVQRKNTHGYTDFIRGRYYNKEPKAMLQLYLNEMVEEERIKIRTLSFDQLWKDLWLQRNKISAGEYEKAKSRFNQINFDTLLINQNFKNAPYSIREYGFPKGRRNRKEDQLQCAMREFEEETAMKINIDQIVSKKTIFEENFVGTNGIQYRHVYFIARYDLSYKEPSIDLRNIKQCEEVRDVKWCTYNEALSLFRHYDHEKKEVLRKAYDYISKLEFLVRDDSGPFNGTAT